MALDLSPKSQFMASDVDAEFHRKLVISPSFERAVSSAMAHYCMNNAPTGEQVEGVKKFIRVLMNLAEYEQNAPKHVSKNLVRPEVIESQIKSERDKRRLTPETTDRPHHD